MADWFMKEVLVALIVGIVSSGIFLGILSRLRPKIEISPWLRSAHSDRPSEGPCYDYLIKITNKTWPLQPIVDVRSEFDLLTRTRREGQPVFAKHHVLPWHPGDKGAVRELLAIPKKNVAYTFRYSFRRPLEEILAEMPDASLRFRLFGRHAFSGFGALFERRFTRDDLRRKESAKAMENYESVDPEQ